MEPTRPHGSDFLEVRQSKLICSAAKVAAVSSRDGIQNIIFRFFFFSFPGDGGTNLLTRSVQSTTLKGVGCLAWKGPFLCAWTACSWNLCKESLWKRGCQICIFFSPAMVGWVMERFHTRSSAGSSIFITGPSTLTHIEHCFFV